MEQDNNKRPSAALINREWFEAAAKALQRDDLCDLLFSAVTYVLYGDMPEGLNTAAEIVFTMIRPALDSDIQRYAERCARNAANARRGAERVGASGSDSQRVGANTTPTPTPTPTPTKSLSPVEVKPEDIEREKWLVYGYFWSTGSKAVQQECSAFWSYYEALGWKNNKGAVIVSKLAAARMWRRQFESGESPNGSAAWFNAIKECSVADYTLWQMYAGAERKESGVVIRLRCREDFLADLIKVLPALRKSLQSALKAPEIDFECISR